MERLSKFFFFLNEIWALPIQLVVITGLLVWQIEAGILGILLILVLVFVFNFFATHCYGKLFVRNIKDKDKRMQVLTQLFENIKNVKFYGIEEQIKSRALEHRQEEVRSLRLIKYIESSLMITWVEAVPLFTLAVMFFLIHWDYEVTIERVYTALLLVNLLLLPMNRFPYILGGMVNARISFNRIMTFLALNEVDGEHPGELAVFGEPLVAKELRASLIGVDEVIRVSNCNFAFPNRRAEVVKGAEGFVLQDVALSVRRGELHMVFGKIGSGKSALLQALLGEMATLEGAKDANIGRFSVRGRLSYVGQTAWVENKTIRENILFGSVYDEKRYTQVVHACALKQDLQKMEKGD